MRYKVDFYEEDELVLSYLYPFLEYAMLAIKNWCEDYGLDYSHYCTIKSFIDKEATA